MHKITELKQSIIFKVQALEGESVPEPGHSDIPAYNECWHYLKEDLEEFFGIIDLKNGIDIVLSNYHDQSYGTEDNNLVVHTSKFSSLDEFKQKAVAHWQKIDEKYPVKEKRAKCMCFHLPQPDGREVSLDYLTKYFKQAEKLG